MYVSIRLASYPLLLLCAEGKYCLWYKYFTGSPKSFKSIYDHINLQYWSKNRGRTYT